MEVASIAELISTVGFPMAMAVAMGWFIFYMVNKTNDQHQKAMEKVQERCREREEKLYAEIAKNREVNEQALQVISKYADRLDTIQKDISTIQTDIAIIKSMEVS